MIGLEPTILGLTGPSYIPLKLHPNLVTAAGIEPAQGYYLSRLWASHVTITPRRDILNVLYIIIIFKVDQARFELTTFTLWVCCSNQLSYRSVLHYKYLSRLLGYRNSNPEYQDQNLVYYHYTITQLAIYSRLHLSSYVPFRQLSNVLIVVYILVTYII